MSDAKAKKIERMHRKMRARLVAQLSDLGIHASEVETSSGAVVAIGTGPTGVIGADKALGIVAAKMRQASAPVPIGAPTRERAAKSPGLTFSVEVRPGQAVHGIQWPPDAIRRELTQAEYDAATKFYHAYYTLHRSHGVGKYGAVGGKSGGANRLAMTELQEKAGAALHAMGEWVCYGMGPIYWDCATNFILEIPMRPGDARPMTWAEFGRLCGNPGDDTAARWIARTMLKAVCAALAGVIADHDRNKARNRRASA